MAKPPVFSNHGCRLNAYETAAMEELAKGAGLTDAYGALYHLYDDGALEARGRAFAWLRRAADEYGFSNYQLYLARAYEHGAGCDVDLVEAR